MKRILAAIILTGIAACNNGEDAENGDNTNSDAPKNISYSIITTYPHDTSSFTQGLIIYKGDMYEGTGLEGRSKLMKVDLKTGNVIRKIDLDAKYFGEGIVILNDTVYQLTLKSDVVFAYALNDFKKVKEFPFNTEGWGITTDGKELIVSDGSSNLYYYEPSSFRLLRTQSITEAGSLAYNLNELEYINGYIYANQWQAPYILKIDPASGAIVAKVDLTDVWRRIQAKDPLADVPNGIAYDSATKKMYVTGKRWPELYEIQFSN